MGLSSNQVNEDKINCPQMGGMEIPKGAETKKAPPLKCPRCESTDTKFCYYNNYSLTQPRHFCRTCHRHWTAGGTLRSIAVGGGRKNKRQKITTTAAPTPVAATFAGNCPSTTSAEIVENSDGFGILLPANSQPLGSELGNLNFGFSGSSALLDATSLSTSYGYSFGGLQDGFVKDKSKSTAIASVEESLVIPAGFCDLLDGSADFMAGGFWWPTPS